jgi:outer membrane protein OmpA-like peptidoglycan-associated protein
MQRKAGVVVSIALLVMMGLVSAYAETMTYSTEEYRLSDTPSVYGFKGLYRLYSPDTAQKGKFGFGLFGEMTRFSLPGDPRYPQVLDISAGGYYGVTDRLEVGASVPFRNMKLPAASADSRWPQDEALKEITASGMGNVSVGARFSLLPGKSFNLVPYVQAFLPTGSDPENGIGADNTRIHFGVSAGTYLGAARLYTQVAYQFATAYDQDRQDFSERGTQKRPRFDYFGTNPLYQEFGNTIFYGAGLAIPVVEDSFELFGEFLGFHSLEDPEYIPMYEDFNTAGKYEVLDDVQDGGMGLIGAQIGFGNGFALKAGWGGKVFGNEPTYDAPMWRAFAALTYNSPETVTIDVVLPDKGALLPPGQTVTPIGEVKPPIKPGEFDCSQILKLKVYFEFDKSALTPEAIATLQQLGRLLRVCSDYSIEVQGHTDSEGTENYNMKLGARRARAIISYLYYFEGIDLNRMVLPATQQQIAGLDEAHQLAMASQKASYGESKLAQMDESIAECKTDDAPIRNGVRAGCILNRRGEFVKP